MKKKIKRYIKITEHIKKYLNPNKSGFEIKEVSAFINGIKHTFTGNRIFISGIELK